MAPLPAVLTPKVSANIAANTTPTPISSGNGNLTGGADASGKPTAAIAPVITPQSSDPSAPGYNSSAPAAAPAAPTMSDLYGTGALDSAAAAADAAKVTANSPQSVQNNEDSASADVLSKYQTQIDALDQAAATARANITSTFAPTAAARTGGAGALAASRGLGGSSFGDAMIDNANEQNSTELQGKIDTSNSDYATQKNNLLQFIQGEADKEASLRQTASTQGADAKISEIQDRTTRANASATASVGAMIQSGITDPSNPNYASTIQQIATSTGLSPQQVESLFTTTKQSQATAAAALQKAQADAATAGQTTLAPGATVIGPDGKVIASLPPKDTYTVVKGTTTTDAFGNQSVSPDRVFDSTTGQFIGTTTGGGSGAGSAPTTSLPSSGATGASTPTTLPPATTPTPAAPATDPNNSHLPIVQTLNGKSFDKNGDPTDGTPAPVTANKPPVDANPKVPFAQYGLLSKTDFNPSNTVDQLAQSYLDKYIKSGTVPTASTLGRGMKPAGFAQVESRAADLYFKATGQPLPTPAIIKSQQDIIANNYKLGNNLKIQEGTVSANIDLSLANMTKNGLNSSGFKPLDDLIDNVKNTLQDPAVGQFLAQNATIQNELGSLLAVKNAGGTTVYDKLESAGIIGKDDSPQQIQTKVNALLKEAGNLSDSLTNANGTAYGFTDPLLQDANNPARAAYMNGGAAPTSSTSAASGAVTAPDGQQVIITD